MTVILPPRVKTIIRQVALNHRLKPADLLGPTRRRSVCDARAEAFASIRALTNYCGKPAFSYPRIGTFFARNHATIMHGVNAHKERLAETAERSVAA